MSATLASVDFHACVAAVKRAIDNPSLFEQNIDALLEAVDALEDDDHEFGEITKSDCIYYYELKYVWVCMCMSLATVFCKVLIHLECRMLMFCLSTPLQCVAVNDTVKLHLHSQHVKVLHIAC